MQQVIEINEIDELADFRPLWRTLLKRTWNASFFQTLEWLETYWKHFGSDQRLRVLLVSHEGETAGIVPLVVRNEQTSLGRVRFLTYPLDHWGTFYGPIGPYPAVTLPAAFRYIRRSHRDWDVFDLRWVPDDTKHLQTCTNSLRSLTNHLQCRRWAETSLVETKESFLEYWSKRPDLLRLRYSDAERDLHEQGEIRWKRHRPHRDTPLNTDLDREFFDVCDELVRKQGLAVSDATTAFLRDVHSTACRLGMVDVNILTLNDEPVACDYGYHCHGHVTLVRTACQEHATGADVLLRHRWLQDCFDRRNHTIDLGWGSSTRTRSWQTRVAATNRLTHYASTSLIAQRLRFKLWASDVARGFKGTIQPDLEPAVGTHQPLGVQS